MSSKHTAITVHNLGKRYRIGFNEKVHDNFVGTLLYFMKSPVSNYRKYRSLYKFTDVTPNSDPYSDHPDIIWALRDVSFNVDHGEVLGIIGRNGAGKSTLLKILSRITYPTTGHCEIRGRISSLIEVGTGFHQELTGRENVYLNGTILGMTKREVDRKFDEIVEFSGISKFIDTPVKRYSSGMKVRLAFSVAAHLEPEILIIDEVLAVGDYTFQKKCLSKMKSVGEAGRTVIMVSHNMQAITRLCGRTILLDDGRIIEDGPPQKVVSFYLDAGLGKVGKKEWAVAAEAPGSDIARLRSVSVQGEDGTITEAVDIRRPFTLQMEYEVLKSGFWLLPNFNLYNEEGTCLFTTMDQDPTWRKRPRPAGRYRSTAHVPGNLLAEGTIFVEPAMMTPDPFIRHFRERDSIAFQIIDSLDGDSARGDFDGRMEGVIRPLLDWSTEYVPPSTHSRAERRI
jgi:lipopolysaccharide transport system ATP-binding protein